MRGLLGLIAEDVCENWTKGSTCLVLGIILVGIRCVTASFRLMELVVCNDEAMIRLSHYVDEEFSKLKRYSEDV